MNITVSKAGPVHYHAHLDGRLLCTSSTPFFSAARVLREEGTLPQTPLTMTHEGSDTICLRSTVGEAANLTVSESDRGLTMNRYRPGPYARPE